MEREKLNSLLIHPRTSLKETMQKLSETAEKILFVVDKHNKLLGSVTDGDVRRGILKGLGFSHAVKTVVNRECISLNEKVRNLGKKVKNIMLEKKIGQIPLVNEDGVIVDICLWNELFGTGLKRQRGNHANPVIIMAGGKGSRLSPFTHVLPKPLIPIGETPVIEIIMKKFSAFGFSHFIYTLNYKKEYIKTFLKELKMPIKIEWIEEDTALGTAGSLALLKGKVSDSFFVTNCDTLLDIDFEDLLLWHKRQRAAITVVGCHQEVKVPFGVLKLTNGFLKNIIEKPIYDVTINTGVYLMEPSVISEIPLNKQLDMDVLIRKMVKRRNVSVYPIHSKWFDVGEWERYHESLNQLKELERKTE